MATAVRRVTIDYAPRRQFLPFHNRTSRFACIVAHRRAGKTVACVNELIKAASTCPKPEGRYAYIAPLFNQAKDVAWTYLKRYAYPLLAAEPNETELRVDLVNGSRIRLYGGDNPDRLRGIYLDGVVLDEYADMSPAIWGEVIRPLLADRQGWATFIGTPKGRNQFYEIYAGVNADGKPTREQGDPNWLTLMLRASETGLVNPDELAAARKDMTPEQYAQEFECSFEAAIIGAYYGKEIHAAENEGRITRVPYDPAFPVQTWWDLGHDDSTSIWFAQYIGREIRLIDYYETSGEELPHYGKVLDAKPYRYAEHILPHDAGAKTLAGGGRTIEMMLRDLGFRTTRVIPVTPDVLTDINAVRLLLPRCWFDAEKTRRGVEALRQYRAEWDDKNKILKARPLHNRASHGADAFRTGAIGGIQPRSNVRDRPRAGHAGAWLG